jgi:hypothetical protein
MFRITEWICWKIYWLQDPCLFCFGDGDFPQYQSVRSLPGTYPSRMCEDRSHPTWKQPRLDTKHSRGSSAENLTTKELSFLWPRIAALFCFKWYIKWRLALEATRNPSNVNVYYVLKLATLFYSGNICAFRKPGSTIIIAQDNKLQNDSILNNLEEFSFYTTDNPHCGHYEYKVVCGV